MTKSILVLPLLLIHVVPMIKPAESEPPGRCAALSGVRIAPVVRETIKPIRNATRTGRMNFLNIAFSLLGVYAAAYLAAVR